MGIELSAEDRAGMTPEEIEALTSADADANLRAVGEQEPEEAEDTSASDDTQATTEDRAAEEKPAAARTDEETAAAAAAEAQLDAEEASTKLPKPLRVDGPADFKAERQALRDEKKAVEAKWSTGEISDEERDAQLTAIDDKIDDLLIAHTRAETTRNFNEQQANQVLDAAIQTVLVESAPVLDYRTAPGAAQQFDAMMAVVQADPTHAGKTALEQARAAHAAVLAIRGIKAPAPRASAPAPAGEPKPRNVPPTLAGLPAASPVGMENDALEKFATLEGEDAEEYLASLPKAQQEQILRAADATALQHTHAPRRGKRAADRPSATQSA